MNLTLLSQVLIPVTRPDFQKVQVNFMEYILTLMQWRVRGNVDLAPLGLSQKALEDSISAGLKLIVYLMEVQR